MYIYSAMVTMDGKKFEKVGRKHDIVLECSYTQQVYRDYKIQ